MQNAPTLPLLIECTAWTLPNKGGTGMLEEARGSVKTSFMRSGQLLKYLL